MYFEYFPLVFYALFLIGYAVCSTLARCAEPNPVYYAYRSGAGLAEGGWFNYTCYQNYYHAYGDLHRQCQNSALSGVPPVCSDDFALYKTVTYKPDRTSNAETTVQLTADGDRTTCDATPIFDVSTTVSWEVNIVQPKAVHKVELVWSSLTGFLLSTVQLLVNNQDCGGIVTPVTTNNTVFITCSTYIMATTVKVSVQTASLQLKLCQYSVYGAETTSACGNPPFIYLAEIEEYTDPHTVKYRCIDYLQYRGLGVVATCQNNNQWSRPPILCQDDGGRLLKLFTGKYPETTDGDSETCEVFNTSYVNFYDIFRRVEVYSVVYTIGKNSTWLGADVGVSEPLATADFPVPLPNPCHYEGPENDTARTRLFTCPGHANGKLIIVGRLAGTPEPTVICDLVISYRIFDKAYECTRKEYGIDYKGLLDITITGEPCDRWADAPAELAVNISQNSHLGNITMMGSFCRNPWPARALPWCWIRNFTDWQYCEVFSCESLCDDDFTEYTGTTSFSADGDTCLPWSSGNKRGNVFFPELFSDDTNEHSYCRNPGSAQSSTWCYTQPEGSTTLKPSPCDIPSCPKDVSIREVYSSDQGVNETMTECIHRDTRDPLSTIHEYAVTFDYSSMAVYCYNSPVVNRTFTCRSGATWMRVYLYCDDVVNFTTTEAVPTTVSSESPTTFSDTTTSESSDSTTGRTTVSVISNPPTTSNNTADGNSPATSVSQVPLINTDTTNPATSNSQNELNSLVTSGTTGGNSPVTSDNLNGGSSLMTSGTTGGNSPVTSDNLNGGSSLITSGTTDVNSSAPSGSHVGGNSLVTSVDFSPTSDSYMSTTELDSIWMNTTDNAANTSTCECICLSALKNKTDDDIMADVESIVLDLLIDHRKLSATYRKYNSMDDDRPSVVYVGGSAVVILSIVITLIIFPDILDLLRYLFNFFFKKKPISD